MEPARQASFGVKIRPPAREDASAGAAGNAIRQRIQHHDKPAATPAPEQVQAAAVSAETNHPAAEDRRNTDRRQPDAERAFAPLSSHERGKRWLPKAWPYLILVMCLAIATTFGVSRVVPDAVSIAVLALSLVGVSCVGIAYRMLAGKEDRQRLAGAIIVAIVPLFLFGLGMTRWTIATHIDILLMIGTLVTVGTVAASYLRHQPGMIFASQMAIWSAAVTANLSWLGMSVLGVAAVISYLTGRQQHKEKRRDEERRAAQERAQTRARDILSDYEETGQGWFWETDRRSLLTYLSAPVAKAVGRDPDAVIGQPLVQLFDLSDTRDASERTLMFHLSTRSAFKELPVRAAMFNSEERWWSISARPIYDDYNNFIGFRGSGTDLTERKRSEEEASRLANFDSLTGLANRFQISQALEKILTSRQEANRHCAVFLLDLDRFKHVNDTMGHPAGDALLMQVSQRLERAVGKMGQVGRLGGDEFKVIVPGSHKKQILANLASEIIYSLSQPYSIDGQRVSIGASVGIAMAPQNGEKSDDLVRNADLALYAAKDGGRGRYHFYAEDLHAEAEARAQLEEDLRDAISKGDLQMFYQPVVSTATEEITGFEALMRWHHPVKGWIPPQRFIQIAEDTGLIAQLGEWALRTACHDLARMPYPIRVAVNVSPLQFSNPQLPAIVTQAIAQAGISAEQLELEITESVFLSDDEGTDAMFKALKNIGVRLALDDFGTGYSSLGYLKKAPFDKIKIDQSFVRGATEEGSRHGAIIASITSLAQSLGMETTAEGVETLDELDLVRAHGCSHVQGYIYDRPLDFDGMAAKLEAGLQIIAEGPRSARAPRQTMLRRVVLDHHGNLYDGTIRNISTTGAMIEGLWNVPVGTIFKLHISKNYVVHCTTRWCEDNRMGVEFSDRLQRDSEGRITAVQGDPPPAVKKTAPEKAA